VRKPSEMWSVRDPKELKKGIEKAQGHRFRTPPPFVHINEWRSEKRDKKCQGEVGDIGSRREGGGKQRGIGGTIRGFQTEREPGGNHDRIRAAHPQSSANRTSPYSGEGRSK